MAEGSFERLPKWAQEKITNLQRTVNEKDAELRNLTGKLSMEEAFAVIETDDIDVNLPLPRGTGVKFILTPKVPGHRAETLDAAVLVDHRGFRYLRLLGDRPISIAPASTNGVEIRML